MKIIKFEILELIHTKNLDSRRDVFILERSQSTVVSTGNGGKGFNFGEANSCTVELIKMWNRKVKFKQ